MLDRDPIYIGVVIFMILAWVVLWKVIPADLKAVYFFLLPILVVILFYLAFVRNKFRAIDRVKALLAVIVILLGAVSFCHAILRIDIAKLVVGYLNR